MGAVKAVIQGTDFDGYVVRSASERRRLEHLAQGYTIIELHHYLFAFMAQIVSDQCKQIVENDALLELIQRRRYIIFDWSGVSLRARTV